MTIRHRIIEFKGSGCTFERDCGAERVLWSFSSVLTFYSHFVWIISVYKWVKRILTLVPPLHNENKFFVASLPWKLKSQPKPVTGFTDGLLTLRFCITVTTWANRVHTPENRNRLPLLHIFSHVMSKHLMFKGSFTGHYRSFSHIYLKHCHILAHIILSRSTIDCTSLPSRSCLWCNRDTSRIWLRWFTRRIP